MFTIPSNDQAFAPNPQSIWMEADIQALGLGQQGVGVISGCAVVPQGPLALAVDVEVGEIQIGGSTVAVSADSVALSAADPDDARVDLIVVDGAGAVSAVTGTPAAITDTSGPRAPDLPASRVLLAMVFVNAAETEIDTAQIVDKRVLVIEGLPGVEAELEDLVVGPASSVDGRVALFDSTTGKLLKQASEGVLSTMSQAEAEAGVATTRRIVTAERLAQAIAALADGGIAPSLFDAKGDLIVATADDTPARKAAGNQGDALFVDSAQADGLVWDRGARLLASSAADVDVVSTASETTVFSFTLPAAALGTARLVHIVLFLDYLNDTGSSRTGTLRLKYGSSTPASTSGSTGTFGSRREGIAEFWLAGNGGTGAQRGVVKVRTSPASNFDGVGVGSSAEDSTGDLTVAITFQHSASAANLSFRKLFAMATLLG